MEVPARPDYNGVPASHAPLRMYALKLHEIMSPPEAVFSPSDSVAVVIAGMAEARSQQAIICANGKPLGTITAAQIICRFADVMLDERAAQEPASTVMASDPLAANWELSLLEAGALLQTDGPGLLNVVDSYGLLVGTVSRADLLTALLQLRAQAGEASEPPSSHWLSLEDSLTGLPNRRAMEMDLRQAEAMARRRREPLTLALIGLDFLGSYGERHGRPAADAALRHVAEVLKRKIRASDKLFRLSGDEFLFLMPGTPAEGAQIAVDRLRLAVDTSGFANDQSPLGHMTVSIGVASGMENPWQTLLKQAQSNLRQAKDRGHNSVCCP